MLTSPKDRERLAAPAGLRDLAEAIVDALASYRRTETRP
jgi:N-acetylmuramoyl-L-alanine amidase